METNMPNNRNFIRRCQILIQKVAVFCEHYDKYHLSKTGYSGSKGDGFYKHLVVGFKWEDYTIDIAYDFQCGFKIYVQKEGIGTLRLQCVKDEDKFIVRHTINTPLNAVKLFKDFEKDIENEVKFYNQRQDQTSKFIELIE